MANAIPRAYPTALIAALGANAAQAKASSHATEG